MDTTKEGEMRAVRITVLALVCALALASVAGGASTRGYSCNYRKTGVTAAIDGYDNSPAMCRIFNNQFSARSTYSHPGRIYCAWIMRSIDVRVRIFSTSRFNGTAFCALLAPQISASDWRRTR